MRESGRGHGRPILSRMARIGIAFSTLLFALAACTPTVQMRAPEEPITINLNIKLDADVRVRLEEQAEQDIEQNPDVF